MDKEKALKNRIQLSIDIDGIPETTTADEHKLKQIFTNLMSNTMKFTPEGGEIREAAKWTKDEETSVVNNSKAIDGPSSIIISVADTGIGIRRKDIDRIFSPFEQGENSAARRFQGTGLGLSLTRNFVELHGGRIRAKSEGERKGSRFSVIFPAKAKTIPSWE
jgi:signal transduction histidine kinase